MSVQQPTTRDGRNIDPEEGALVGEGATIRVSRPIEAYPGPTKPLARVPSEVGAAEPSPTYYGQPAIKEPVWRPVIPLYFHVGGLSGATSVLVAVADLAAPRRLRRLRRYGSAIAFSCDCVGSAFLIYDLGRPSRFLNMLRVLRPTSPMSVGSWVLAGSGAMSFLATFLGGRGGPLGRVGAAASLASGVLGLPLSSYTAVLLANSAVPVWQETRRTLPILFVASSMASAGGLLALLPIGRAGRRVARHYGDFGKAAEILATAAVMIEATRAHRRVARPLHRGASGAIFQTALAVNAAALVLSLRTGARRGPGRVAAAALGMLGSMGVRLGVFFAGKASARDPRATFEPQRAGLGAAEVTQRMGRVEAEPEKPEVELPEEAIPLRLA